MKRRTKNFVEDILIIIGVLFIFIFIFLFFKDNDYHLKETKMRLKWNGNKDSNYLFLKMVFYLKSMKI